MYQDFEICDTDLQNTDKLLNKNDKVIQKQQSSKEMTFN